MHDIFQERESEVRGYCRAWPTVFTSASNAEMVDEAGKSYIDFFAGAGVLNFGHNNPRMKRAIIEFLEKDGIAHSLDLSTTPKREFMTAFVDTILKPRNMPHKLQFTGPTGTNAVEAAMKLARRVTGRTRILAFQNGFHGMTLGALAATANGAYRCAAGLPLEHVDHAPYENSVGGGMPAIESLRAQYQNISSGAAPPAGILIEVIQAEGGVNVGTAEWLRAVQQLAREVGALLIIDDIQAGCGRTGPYFSFDGLGLDPDIVCLAKGIGGFGTPLAMNLVKPEHDAKWEPGEHTGTFRGQGISFVAGREALRYFEDEELQARTLARGQMMAERLAELAKGNEHYEVRGRGMMQALDVGETAVSKAIARKCFDTGLLVGACGERGRVLKLIPPLTIEDDRLEAGMKLFEEAVHSAAGVTA